MALGAGTGATAARFSAVATTPVSTFEAGTWSTADDVTVAPIDGCTVGSIRHNRQFYVYAKPPGSPSSVTADISQLSTKAGPSPLVAGSWTLGGTTYTFRSAVETADKALTDGPVTISVDADGAASSATVLVDNVKPVALDVQASNGTGTAGIADSGDTVTYTFSEPMDPCSLVAGWDGSAATAVRVQIKDNGGSKDELTVWDPSGAVKVPLGNLNLGPARGDYTAGAAGATFSATMTLSGATVTLTLGSLDAGSVRSASGADTMVWNPQKEAQDAAGNDTEGVDATETGAIDREF